MESIKSFTDNSLSFYRTTHYFERYGEFYTVDQFREYCDWAKTNNTKVYILGNGSNTLFTGKNVKSLVLKNKLIKQVNALPNNTLEVSSSVLVIDVLKYCYENQFESFYYLASVPATIGGALAMNAGRGKQYQLTIYDFVETINFFDFESNCIKTVRKEEVIKGYRETIFTGIKSSLILSATFKFNNKSFKENPIIERCKWSKKNQDNSSPNCGSVFKKADFHILNRFKGFSFGKTAFSSKTYNWILSNSSSSFPIVILIYFVRILHFVQRKVALLEVITVD
ncbi:MAG: FAD-binding protein [Desmonostoc vinosum HA7617-LM4]|jgi:UDP-N-acetylmuramate dehydrogenase|nr:FAD-binding protein [Desmonostoc vinosum HA7617-LM4]